MVFLVELGQGTHDARSSEICLAFSGSRADLDVARMHVGVEEPIAKNTWVKKSVTHLPASDDADRHQRSTWLESPRGV
jgi:hypothetical protein